MEATHRAAQPDSAPRVSRKPLRGRDQAGGHDTKKGRNIHQLRSCAMFDQPFLERVLISDSGGLDIANAAEDSERGQPPAKYRQPNVSEEEFYHWATEQHAARAAKLHAKDGMQGFSIFLFRDMEALYKETVQADLQALQAKRHLLSAARGQKSSQSETVKVDNLDEAGKPTFLPFKEMSQAP
ncbi:hypothetical protein CNMCM8694_004502 [Aspergillus lentulus]|nr:hypothetical protein CNMCM8060_004646 [Aspergillus lentulus]KAF4176438.1 hypothetical protein CNMCM7927_004158 [Aspergillus lentulus]KAF4188913.1 hypothetical protein CNMCM8694_004502 [Aspergillus lentulus]